MPRMMFCPGKLNGCTIKSRYWHLLEPHVKNCGDVPKTVGIVHLRLMKKVATRADAPALDAPDAAAPALNAP